MPRDVELSLEHPECVPMSNAVFLSPQLGLDMEELEEIEEDAGLGNGGLGRLAGERQRSGLCLGHLCLLGCRTQPCLEEPTGFLSRRRKHVPTVDAFVLVFPPWPDQFHIEKRCCLKPFEILLKTPKLSSSFLFS